MNSLCRIIWAGEILCYREVATSFRFWLHSAVSASLMEHFHVHNSEWRYQETIKVILHWSAKKHRYTVSPVLLKHCTECKEFHRLIRHCHILSILCYNQSKMAF
jgi:hypothetical protein